jgi:osmotically-inducible protein OsmY
MKTDAQIQTDVSHTLAWDPSIHHERIGVTATDGIVTLSGSVPSYFEKMEAEKITQRVGGVKAVVEKIDVKSIDSYLRDDEGIAQAILNQFKWSFSVPSQLVKVKVEKGWVTLSGEVEWDYQREAAKACTQDLMGVKGVSNQITLKARTIEADAVKHQIEKALQNAAARDSKQIKVAVHGSTVTLSGYVDSLAEMENAKWAAWGAPGVMRVDNKISLNS